MNWVCALRVVASMPRPATDSEAPAPRRVAAELWLAGGAVVTQPECRAGLNIFAGMHVNARLEISGEVRCRPLDAGLHVGDRQRVVLNRFGLLQCNGVPAVGLVAKAEGEALNRGRGVEGGQIDLRTGQVERAIPRVKSLAQPQGEDAGNRNKGAFWLLACL